MEKLNSKLKNGLEKIGLKIMRVSNAARKGSMHVICQMPAPKKNEERNTLANDKFRDVLKLLNSQGVEFGNVGMQDQTMILYDVRGATNIEPSASSEASSTAPTEKTENEG